MNSNKIVPYEDFLVTTLRILFCSTDDLITDDDFLLFYNTKNIDCKIYKAWEPFEKYNLEELFSFVKSIADDYFYLHLKS